MNTKVEAVTNARCVKELTLADRLAASTLTPGTYKPTSYIKTCKHAAVIVNSHPVVLCGPAEDADSVAQAKRLAVSSDFARLLWVAGFSGEVKFGIVDGKNIEWTSSCSALVSKPSGKVEFGDDFGIPQTILLSDKLGALAAAMCVTTKVAQAIDPFAPNMDLVH